MNRIKKLLQSKLSRELISYCIFGVLTTAINIIVFHVGTDVFRIHYLIANVAAWILSVSFAYITNKLFVFHSKDVSGWALLREIGGFFVARLISLGIDELGMMGLVGGLHMGELPAKIIMNVIVIIANYAFSKLFIFKKQDRPLPEQDGAEEQEDILEHE